MLFLDVYIMGLLGLWSFMVLWFLSPFKITLGKILFNKEFNTPVDFDDYLFIKNKVLGKLLSCWICTSFWTSLLIGIVIYFVYSTPLTTPLITFSTYPSITYLFKVLIKG